MGESAGGLLAAAALTQRPDVAAAVACIAPLTDMARYEYTGLGELWVEEFGSADDPTELAWLLGYSPYHHVRAGTAYPATLFVVEADDERIDPAHPARCARRCRRRRRRTRPSCSACPRPADTASGYVSTVCSGTARHWGSLPATPV